MIIEILAWIAVAISITASLLSSHRNKYCMILYFITACWWSIYNFWLLEIPCYQQGWLRFYYMILAIYSYITWKKQEIKDSEKIKKLEIELAKFKNSQ